MPLKPYRQIRNFKITSEPKGKLKSKLTASHPLYVIQKHAASHLHYDFRLELDGVLKSWAIPKGPSLDPNVKRLAVHVEDHPIDYGDFEGYIPKGQYGGGAVMLWDKGEWFAETNKLNKEYQKGHLTFELKGKKLKGLWKLVQMKSDPKNWLLIKVNDKYARHSDAYDLVLTKNKSVKSNKTIEQLTKQYSSSSGSNARLKKKIIDAKSSKKQKMPSSIKPELATLMDKPPTGNQWLHEIKFDGYRLIAFIKNNKIKLMTRGGKNWTAKFSNIVKALKQLDLPDSIIDGEVVILDKNQHSNFQLLQNALKIKKDQPFVYYVFDLIYCNGSNLSLLPLIKRKNILKKLISNKNVTIRYSDHVTGSGEKVFAESCRLSLEGIVSKAINSQYLQKRTTNWLKIKCSKRQEFIICGYTLPNHRRKCFGSLLLGVYSKNKELIYCGHVGTGFTESALHDLFKELQKYKATKMPFKIAPPDCKNVVWTKPTLIAEVAFTEWTKDHILRHPSFKGLRKDKSPQKVIIEKTVPHSLNKNTKLTHPDKVLYPQKNITKIQLFEYYNCIKKWILPYIINRPLTLVRCPDGQDKECFYQKHITKSASQQLKSLLINKKNKKESYMYIDDVDGLLSLPQLGVLEIHTWGSNITKVDYPDMLIFDVDPSPEIKWKNVVEAAFEIRDQLKKLKLKSFVKVTGGKGLHVVVPINPEYEWKEVKLFAYAFTECLAKKSPNKYVTTVSKSKRTGKIFLDYLRNQRGATAIAPYSTRAKANATIAMPIGWNELTSNRKDTVFNIKSACDRLNNLKQDPWKDFFKIRQSLKIKF